MIQNPEAVQLAQKAAQRLLKTRLRTHVFSSVELYAPLLLSEEPLARAAEREWQDVLTSWGSGDKAVLTAIVREAFSPAATEVLAIFDEPSQGRALIDGFWATFDAEVFVQVCP
jgi:hypothetical protein